jgi:NAD(P)-dependent dehydrogenase (short-subunit alcohol dehydrogenase family)
MGMLDGKVALVTGASRGIGAEIARRFGAEGAAVAVAARTRDGAPGPFPGTIDETVAEIGRAGGTAVAIPADLARPEDRTRLVEETTARLGALAPTRVVPTPGTIFHHLTSEDDPRAEPPAVMAEAGCCCATTSRAR